MHVLTKVGASATQHVAKQVLKCVSKVCVHSMWQKKLVNKRYKHNKYMHILCILCKILTGVCAGAAQHQPEFLARHLQE